MAYFIQTMYNVGKPVGVGQPNVAEDVRLVQLMLTELAKYAPGWAPPVPLPVDGRYSDNFRRWIAAFQTYINQTSSFTAVVDGKVHPMPMRYSTDFSRTIGGYLSTMHALNTALFRTNEGAHTAVRQRLGLVSSHTVL